MPVDSGPVYIVPRVSPAFVHVRRTVCAGVCRRTSSIRLLDGCSRQVIRSRCTVSLAFERCLCMRSERYVLKRSGLSS